ncbi:hypothetical protein JG687_00007249 [Phytophthora cactorum]|uniref:Uncharacterized protein n=1 Tax=Phytophthora cactorum TaxID=29920 RepID=A0A8T1UFR2_9STRA|nr:hypothetical protein PC120_g2964 [Phytophthora cactorum]KAG3092411.1 hypothetical protein PC121_g3579 [Phytophthora cactorum]KAG4061340.1 hypothetical protein PC123_g3745 [Phytophthora cactorum]KAG6962284.1 hypothetical protein JG687_00007249 [Phytophthora cactorum]
MHPSLNLEALWPSPPRCALPPRRSRSLRSSLARAMFPRVMEFKVISRESEKHEFMPVVYLIDRSPAWRRRVPSFVETAIVEDYITPLVAKIPDSADAANMTRILADVRKEMEIRANLIDETQLDGVSTDETDYKMGVFVDFAPTPSNPGKAPLNRVVFQIATALRVASYRRALVVPVAVHYCSATSFLDVRRYTGIRYGAPVLLEEREVAIFGEDPTEFTQHFSARLRASLTMPPPPSVAQIEMLRLTRTLHVYCAKVVRDDCFSRRQRASMNEEIMQIHFRTSNHPDMHELKRNMMKYCATLKHWKLRDEDINSASVLLAVEDLPKHPLHFVWLLAAALRFVFKLPGRLFLASACDLIYRFPPRKSHNRSLPVGAAAVKATLGCLALGVLVRVVPSSSLGCLFALLVALVLIVDAATAHTVAADVQHLTQHWKKLQFYVMDADEWTRLKETRAVLARSIHDIVARYMCTDLPPPVLQDASKSAASPTSALLDNDEYTLNAHHKIFINAPRSFPLSFAAKLKDSETARRVIYAPKMLRDETWRNIYETLAPGHLRFRVLLAENKGDNLPMDKLLATPFFGAVLSAYILYKTRHTDGDILTSSSSGDDSAHLMSEEMQQEQPRYSQTEQDVDEQELGGYGSIQDIIHAALQMAQDEEELTE